MAKSLLNSPAAQVLIGSTIGLYMRLVGATTRWRDVNRVGAERLWAEGGGVIACVWHGRFMLAHKLWSFKPGVQPIQMLISQSREGAVVTHAAHMVGSGVIRGSAAKKLKDGGAKSKGGFEAMREMARHLNAGGAICLTPDGPRGPRMRARLGPVQLAKLTGAPLLCMTWSMNRRVTLKSWDRLMFPLPFGRGARVWGALIHVPRDADDVTLERARLALEAEMNRIAAEADRLAGGPTIEPAPVDPVESAEAAMAR